MNSRNRLGGSRRRDGRSFGRSPGVTIVRAVERRQLPRQVAKLNKPVNRPQQMLGWNVLFERKLIEQRGLFALPMSHDDLQPCLLQRLNQRTSRVELKRRSTETARSDRKSGLA